MSKNAVVVVLYNMLPFVAGDQNFGAELAEAINQTDLTGRPTDVGAGPTINAAQVISVADTDDAQIVAIGGNYGSLLTKLRWGNRELDTDTAHIEIVERLRTTTTGHKSTVSDAWVVLDSDVNFRARKVDEGYALDEVFLGSSVADRKTALRYLRAVASAVYSVDTEITEEQRLKESRRPFAAGSMMTEEQPPKVSPSDES